MKLTKSLDNLDVNKKYLLAVSGGVDSMVLLNLFFNSSYMFSVVHCNFQLRGEDSFLDEQLVREYCKKNELEFFFKTFDTLSIKKNRESIEMVARDLRYNYFKEILKEYKFDSLVTAHHLNDNVETFFINLLRGSGLKGLAGMQKISKYILRPLLSFTRDEIVNFAKENKIQWREDKTNQELDYLRNKIRHRIIPELTDINPKFLNQAEKSMEIVHEVQNFIEKKVYEMKYDAEISFKEDISVFSLEKLQKAEFLLVYHFLSAYGFTNKTDCRHILHAETGSFFESDAYEIWVDRGRLLIVNKIVNTTPKTYLLIESIPYETKNPVNFKIFSNEDENNYENGEVVDFDKINFPLTLRNWREGDVFYPINGVGKKKVSKFLKDSKVSGYQKKSILVLCDKVGKIIWLVGFRLDDQFKITKDTKKYIHLILSD